MRFSRPLFLLTASSLMATAAIQAQGEGFIDQEALSVGLEEVSDKECGKNSGKKPKFKFPERTTPSLPPGFLEGQAAASKESIVYFSMSVNVPPADDFVFYPANQGNGQPNPFDPVSTNPSEPSYASTFLVPANGTITNLSIRADITANSDVSPSFLFTVYAAESTVGSITPISSWTETALSKSTDTFTLGAGESATGTFQNLGTSVNVAAGTLLTVVITPEGYDRYDVQPATFSASFTYIASKK